MTPRPTETGQVALPRGWWAPALALAERPVGGVWPRPSEYARARVADWRAAYGSGRFDLRLVAAGLDELTLHGLLDEPPADLAARVARPAWVDTVERALHAATVRRPPDTDDWRAAFALPLRPFVADAAADLTGRAAGFAHHVDVAAIVAAFTARLSRHLVHLATPTFAHEAGTVPGALKLAARLTDPAELGTLFATYPVLARLLGQASTFYTDAAAELLARFAADRPAIVETLLGGTDPGPLAEVRTDLGDTHHHGRSVAVLTFADGRRAVYKPRDLAAHEQFGAAVRWLNTIVPELGLRTVAAVPRAGYGWLEFVSSRPVPDAETADRFYRRHGALLVLLHALHAADMHVENVIACGDQPVLVDVETLFHPSLAAPAETDPAARMLSDSVRRTGLLPVMVVGEGGAADVSGLGGAGGADVVADWAPDEHGTLRRVSRTVPRAGTGNRPRLDDRELDVVDHDKALLEGFRLAYDAIVRHRTEFTDLLETCADLEVRVVLRHSVGYATLLADSTRPELMRDALARDHAFDVLWTDSAHHPLRWRASRHEQADLWAGDVPLFTSRAGSADLWSAHGHRLPGVLERPGLASALAKVNAMSDVDRRDQEWIIAAALATRAPAAGHRAAAPMPGHLGGTAAPPERLLVAACALADQIVARNLTDGDRVNWLGLELVDDRQWLVLPMGAGLANGYVGVALFLAQLTELSGIARYADMARHALRGLPTMFGVLATRPDLVDAVGCGGFHGFGGIAYGLARLTTLLGDDRLRDATRTAVALAATAAGSPGGAGVATGGAGCLAAMTAVHAELGLAEAATLAQDCADGLGTLVRRTDGRVGGSGGFFDGAAGVAWALAKHDADAAAGAIANAHAAPGDLGWCTGLAGLAMAGAADPADTAALLADRPVLGDLSLCHGELGIAEALTVLATTGDRTRTESVAAARRRRAGLVLDALTQHRASCGTPGGVPTPGLLTGLAGIGYGLLRLGFAERVPSVLLLEPSRTPGIPGALNAPRQNGEQRV
jgi:type 2 lantibiotic biosynthesis protein LanM